MDDDSAPEGSAEDATFETGEWLSEMGDIVYPEDKN